MEKTNKHNDIIIVEKISPPAFELIISGKNIEREKPKRPLQTPLNRAMTISGLAVGLTALALGLIQLRPDLKETSWVVTWGPGLVEMAGGCFSFFLVMRLSVPGYGAVFSRSAVFGMASILFSLMAALAAPHLVVVTHPGLKIGLCAMHGFQCMRFELFLGAPLLILSLWMASRGAPVTPVLAGFLSGLGAGMISDAAIHLKCMAVNPQHTVVWHLGAVVLLSITGAVIGRFLPKW